MVAGLTIFVFGLCLLGIWLHFGASQPAQIHGPMTMAQARALLQPDPMDNDDIYHAWWSTGPGKDWPTEQRLARQTEVSEIRFIAMAAPGWDVAFYAWVKEEHGIDYKPY